MTIQFQSHTVGTADTKNMTTTATTMLGPLVVESVIVGPNLAIDADDEKVEAKVKGGETKTKMKKVRGCPPAPLVLVISRFFPLCIFVGIVHYICTN